MKIKIDDKIDDVLKSYKDDFIIQIHNLINCFSLKFLLSFIFSFYCFKQRHNPINPFIV